MLVLIAAAAAYTKPKTSPGGFLRWVGKGRQYPRPAVTQKVVVKPYFEALLIRAEEAIAAGNLTSAESLITAVETEWAAKEASTPERRPVVKPTGPEAPAEPAPTNGARVAGGRMKRKRRYSRRH